MTVAKWEFWTLANTLVATHGLEAEAEAVERLQRAIANRDSGQSVVWQEVLDRIPGILKEQGLSGE